MQMRGKGQGGWIFGGVDEEELDFWPGDRLKNSNFLFIIFLNLKIKSTFLFVK